MVILFKRAGPVEVIYGSHTSANLLKVQTLKIRLKAWTNFLGSLVMDGEHVDYKTVLYCVTE